MRVKDSALQVNWSIQKLKHSRKEKVTSLGQKKSSKKKLDQDFINLIDDLLFFTDNRFTNKSRFSLSH